MSQPISVQDTFGTLDNNVYLCTNKTIKDMKIIRGEFKEKLDLLFAPSIRQQKVCGFLDLLSGAEDDAGSSEGKEGAVLNEAALSW
jgi:hypothetical protein